ncbi:Hint domain-containing protein [Roseovarius sp. LXJ103]|uniref:Hint domain-containing protein n=1 Tax=Roseovarius carneus TaxID=2853164 RepID=UPI000D61A39A|nr:Hint domain-containing protein [Roseovarius carneus]MBZ8119297.1 Hint domain-containing protein [Roseovarius carneus]PWE35086.1 hypothetical protein DD563_03330 [Pelagicola sp. LXJ1103]
MTLRSENPAHIQTLHVFRSSALTVINGANLGDALSFGAELDLDDTYELHQNAHTERLIVTAGPGGTLIAAPKTNLGRAGHVIHIDCCLTLMTPMGVTTEVVVLVEVDAMGDVEAVYALPLAVMTTRTDYTLVGIDVEGARTRFAEVACVAFTRGTRITMASGAQKPVEELQDGDMVLTRDDGPRAVTWIGRSTARAVGDFAPICIKAGALHNEGDLYVSPDHRLFIYQRSDALGAGRHEVLVRARHLLNGDTIVQEPGGFVDYFQLLFDDHQIIYAEGIAAETLLVDTRTRAALPAYLNIKLAESLPGHEGRRHMKFEVGEALLNHPDAAALLRRASTR